MSDENAKWNSPTGHSIASDVTDKLPLKLSSLKAAADTARVEQVSLRQAADDKRRSNKTQEALDSYLKTLPDMGVCNFLGKEILSEGFRKGYEAALTEASKLKIEIVESPCAACREMACNIASNHT